MVKLDYNQKALLLRQYLRAIPAYLGMINRGAFLLQIKEIRSTDIFLVSFPKSGNTWVRYVLAMALTGKKEIDLQEIENIVPDVYISKSFINKQSGRRIIKSHDPLFDYYPAMIYIVRDFRNVAYSYFSFRKKMNEYHGDLSMFLKDMRNMEFGSWVDHVEGAFRSKENGKSVFFLRYEELISNPISQFQTLLESLKIIPALAITDIVESSSLKNLRLIEESKGPYLPTGESFFSHENEISSMDMITIENHIRKDEKLLFWMKKLYSFE